MDAEPIKLFKEIKQRGFHSSIATTYSVDGAFYDGPVQRRLRHFECLNNILIADVSMLSRALGACPETFAAAGQRYAVVPARVRGCFHPKVLLQLGERRARLFVGSANMTSAAWGRNLEIAACFDYRTSDPENAPIGALIRKAYEYLDHWLAPVGGDSMAHKVSLHYRDSPWLAELRSNTSPVVLPDGSAADLLCERGDGKPGIIARLLEFLDGERVQRLVVVSPYWDDDLSALRVLRQALGMPMTTIGISAAVGEFPISAARKEWKLRFAAVPADEENRRFVHAKIFVISTNKADHVVFGSANCSDAALGSLGRGGMNAEVSIYRRLRRGMALPMLGIDLTREIEPRVTALQPRPIFEGGARRIPAGQVELSGTALKWWPALNVSGDGATLLAEGRSRRMTRNGDCFLATFDEIPAPPIVVQFCLSNGKVTEPTIVHDTERLLRSSPGVVNAKTMQLFGEVLEGKADLIDLAQRANDLFVPTRGRSRRGGGGGGEGERTNSPLSSATEYSTPADFRSALELPSDAIGGHRSHFVTKDPTLLGLLRVVLRGIVDVPGPNEDRAREREKEQKRNEQLLEGETEDGNEIAPSEVPDPSGAESSTDPADPPPTQKQRDFYTAEEINRRRRYLLKAVTKFLRMLKELGKDVGPVSENLAAQACFIFSVMSVAVRLEHKLQDGSSTTLMTFEPRGNDRDSAFVVLAAQMLQLIWVGQARNTPIWSRLPPFRRDSEAPQDIRIFVVMSRWVVARAHSAVAAGRNRSLLAIVGKLAVQVFAATRALAHVDPREEEMLIGQLDRSVGFLASETAPLLKRIKALSSEVGRAVTESTPRLPKRRGKS